MLSTAFARNAYSETGRAQPAPRRMEYQAFARVTHRLVGAIEAGPAGFPRLAEAAVENMRLWTLLAADLAEEGNALPESLRAQIISLAIFSARHTEAVLAGRASAEILVDINTAIMRGLRAEPVAGHPGGHA